MGRLKLLLRPLYHAIKHFLKPSNVVLVLLLPVDLPFCQKLVPGSGEICNLLLASLLGYSEDLEIRHEHVIECFPAFVLVCFECLVMCDRHRSEVVETPHMLSSKRFLSFVVEPLIRFITRAFRSDPRRRCAREIQLLPVTSTFGLTKSVAVCLQEPCFKLCRRSLPTKQLCYATFIVNGIVLHERCPYVLAHVWVGPKENGWEEERKGGLYMSSITPPTNRPRPRILSYYRSRESVTRLSLGT